MEILTYALQFLLALTLADLLAGTVHWLTDSYGTPQTPLIGKAVSANILHHDDQRHFLQNNWWQNARSSLPIVLAIAGLFYLIGWINPFTLMVLLFGWNANEIHKWAHQSKRERPWIATKLQEWRLLQSPKHHYRHHRNNNDSDYCVITTWLNPFLNFIHFWRNLEWLIYKLSGLKTREDPFAKNTLPTAKRLRGPHSLTFSPQRIRKGSKRLASFVQVKRGLRTRSEKSPIIS